MKKDEVDKINGFLRGSVIKNITDLRHSNKAFIVNKL
jgi:hypothetical protein